MIKTQNNETIQLESRLKKAIIRIKKAAQDLWTMIKEVGRGQRNPLPKNTGILQTVGIYTLNYLALVMLIIAFIPAFIYGTLGNASKHLITRAKQQTMDMNITEPELAQS